MIQMLMEIRMLTEMRLERQETEVIRRDKVISLQAGAAPAVSEKNTNNTRIRRVQLISQYIMVSIWPERLSTIIVNSPNIVARGSNIILNNTVILETIMKMLETRNEKLCSFVTEFLRQNRDCYNDLWHVTQPDQMSVPGAHNVCLLATLSVYDPH